MPQLLYLLAGVGLLFLALIVAATARRTRGAFPLSLLCLALFVWDLAQALSFLPGASPRWKDVRLLGSSLAPAFLWHFAALFSQRGWELRPWTVGLYAFTALFWASTAAAFLSPAVRAWVDGAACNAVYLAVFLPFMAAALALLVRHARRAADAVERNASVYIAVGIAVGIATAVTELIQPVFPRFPRLGHVGSALSTVLLAVALFRHRLLQDDAPAGRLLGAVLLVLSAALVLVVGVPAVPEPLAAGFLAAVVAGVAALALRRLLFARLLERLERRERLALIGTMAAGVAHEVRNPLAAIRGAAQFVQREIETAKLPGESADYLRLLVGEVDRLDGVVESFLAFARPVEPKRRDVDLKALLADVVRLQPEPARVKVEVEEGLPPAAADPALLASAVSNVVRNAVEAAGAATVRVRRERDGLRELAAIEVEDAGPGIPEAERGRVFQPFYTTKTKGTGLGLAIAQRVAEAHDGSITLDPVAPHGCRFTIRIPLRVL
jgi:signal transduction histidine kinase